MARSRSTAKAGKKKNVLSLDLSNVEGRVLVPEGDYPLKVKTVTQEEGNAADYLKWEFVIVGGKYDGKSIKPYNTSLSPQALWNLRGLLEALDFDVPDSAFDLDFDELVDMEMMGSIEHDEYEGRKSSALVDFWPLDGEAGDDAGGDDAGAEEGGADELTEDDINEMDEQELAELNRDHKLGVRIAKLKSVEKMREAVLAAAVEAGIVGGSDDNTDEPITQEEILDMDQDELQEFVEENELEGIDFKKLKTLAKMRAAVVDAAEAAGLIADDEPEPEPEPEPAKPSRRKRR